MRFKDCLFLVFLSLLILMIGCSSPSNSTVDLQEDNYVPHNPDEQLSLENLQGMFSGFRDDFGGDECGGMCWDFYTFLPNNKVVVGLPVNGGPETINCVVDECQEYTISNYELKLENGETYPIELSDRGLLVINSINLSAVQPVPEGTAFNNLYKFIGYRGLIGINASSSSWTYFLSLYPDGTFELSGVTLGNLGGNSGTSTDTSHTSGDEIGTYEIKNNTMTMTSSDGTVEKLLFFIHESDINDIQIGDKNYYVDDD